MVSKYILGFLLVLLVIPLGLSISDFEEVTSEENIIESKETPIRDVQITRAPSQIQNIEQVRNRIEEKKQELENEADSKPPRERNIYRNQNTVREAVHTLLALRESGEFEGGIGQEVSQIAIEFNNSVNRTIQAETKVQQRSGIMRRLFGANEEEIEAAEEIEVEITRNRERIQELKQIREDCDCSDEAKELIREKIQNMEQEQNRLENVAKNGKSKGLLGWLFK